MTPAERAVGELRRDCAHIRTELSRFASQVQKLQRRTDRLSALRAEEPGAVAWLDRFERTLDAEAVDAHLRTVVAKAVLVQDPIPHLQVPDLLPIEVYRALVDAIPARVFFEGGVEQGLELRIPPRVAPVHGVVAWAFLTEVVLRSLSPLLVARFEEPLAASARTRFPDLPPFREWGVEVTLSRGRIVGRGPGYVGPGAPDRPWDLLTTVLDLARPHDNEEAGSELQSMRMPFRANTSLTFLGHMASHAYSPIPEGAAATERYSYEFGIGPDKEGQRRLAAMIHGDK